MRARPEPLLLALLTLASGCLGLSQAFDAPAADPPLTAVGDDIRFHHRVFDASGTLLFSSRAADRPLLEAVRANWTDGLFALPPPGDSPSTGSVGDGRAPFPFPSGAAVPVGQTLVGKSVGFVAAFPVVGRVTGYEETLRLERLRGPFPRTLDVSLERLAASGFDATGDEVRLDDALVGRVLARGEDALRLRFDAADGERFIVQNADLPATVEVDEATDAFSFRLDAAAGHAFALTRGCSLGRYVLEPGSYRVTAATEDDLVLERSPTRYPQFLGRDLILIVEIVEIVNPKVIE